jgi:hypothetical protein
MSNETKIFICIRKGMDWEFGTIPPAWVENITALSITIFGKEFLTGQ